MSATWSERYPNDSEPIEEIHGLPVCPKCGSKHMDEGGDVREAGSWEEGPLYWLCEACDTQWGHA